MSLREIVIRLSEMQSFEGKKYQSQMLTGDSEVLQIIVDTRAEFPSYLSKS